MGMSPLLEAIKNIVEALDPTPIGLAMEGGQMFGDAIDPHVNKAKRAYRYVRIERWLAGGGRVKEELNVVASGVRLDGLSLPLLVPILNGLPVRQARS